MERSTWRPTNTHSHFTHTHLSTWSRSAKSASVSVMRQSCVNATPEAIMAWLLSSWSRHQSSLNGKLIMARRNFACWNEQACMNVDDFLLCRPFMFTLRQVVHAYGKCWWGNMYWYLISRIESRFIFLHGTFKKCAWFAGLWNPGGSWSSWKTKSVWQTGFLSVLITSSDVTWLLVSVQSYILYQIEMMDTQCCSFIKIMVLTLIHLKINNI